MKNSVLQFSAFTILEAVITLVISGIIIAFVYQIYNTISFQFKQYSETQKMVIDFNQFSTVFTRDMSLCQKIESASNNNILLKFPENDVTYTFEKEYAIRKGVLSDTFNVFIKSVVRNKANGTTKQSSETIRLNTEMLGRAFVIFEKKPLDLATLINNKFLNEH